MSIINDALKKLQDQISHSNPKTDAIIQQTELTPAQQAGFQPIPLNNPHETYRAPEQKTKESRLVLILGIMCLLIGLFAPIINKQSVILTLLAKLPKQNKITKTVPVAAKTPVLKTITPKPVKKQEPVSSLIKNLTAPISKPSANSQSRIIINGIMTRGQQNLALIDGQIYEEGEEVDGVKIIKITTKGATVLENGVEHSVKVMGQ